MRPIALMTLLATSFGSGCGGYELYGSIDTEWGATPGGPQDIGVARELIAQGQVPQASDFPVEGLLSEHDLPTVGEPCEDLLCLRPALGVAPSLETGELERWVQLGMTSGLPVPYARPPIDLVMVIDRSSSMAGDMVETLQGVATAVEQLRADDQLGIVVFSDQPRVLRPLGPVEDADAVIRALMAIDANGGWDLQPAMDEALAMHRQAGGDPTRLRRISLLSCGYPLIDAQYGDPFSQLVREAAGERIGTSVYGVLLGYDRTLTDMLGSVRGGSAAYLDSLERVEEVFATDFDLMVSPLAYDLHLELKPGAGQSVAAMYGVPGDDDGFDVATTFLSQRKGAVFARLQADADAGQQAGAGVATVSMSYEPESAHGWSGDVAATVEVMEPEDLGADGYFAGSGVRKGVALINEAEQMSAACGLYHGGDAEAAILKLDVLLGYLQGEATALEDEGLQSEVALVEALRANMGG